MTGVENKTASLTQGGAVVARLAHNQKVVGSSPTPATSLNVMEVPVATKRLGEDRNVKSEITDCSESTPQ